MATEIKRTKKEDEGSIVGGIMFRYMPYWPLFAVTMFLMLSMAWAYIRFFTVPSYRISASILIKDERKGVEDSKTIEALNTVGAKTTAENEMQVIGSRQLIKQVALSLSLYAPVYEEDYFKVNSAYTSSPVNIEAKDPDAIVPQQKIYFQFNNNIIIGNSTYKLDQWVETPFGVLRFSKNPHKIKDPVKPLFFTLRRVGDAVSSASGALDVSSNKLSSVINLSYVDEVPQRGKDVLNEVIKAYNQNALNEKNTLSINTIAFLNERVKESGKELDSIEQKAQNFKATNQIVDLSEQGKQYLQNVGENDKRLTDINTQLTVLDEVDKYVRSKDDSKGSLLPSTLGVNDPTLTKNLEQLNNAQLQYESLKKSMGENNPLVTSVANQIENIRPTILETIGSQRKNLMASKANLSSSNSGYGQMLQTIPGKEKELAEILRQKEIRNQVYAFLLQKREEAQLKFASTLPDSKIVDPAEASDTPISPKKLVIYLSAFILALVISIAYVTLRETLSNKIIFRSDIEEFTSVPVIAEITYVSKPNLFNRFEKKKKIAVAEQFRQLRMAFKLYRKQTVKKRLLVTSSIGGEGKSFISSNLAKSLASSGKKVVLIDFDMRNPKTSALFNLDNKDGIKEYLNDNKNAEDIIQRTEHENLFVIPAGEPAINPTELLLNSSLGRLFDYLENAGFDHIIADTAPIQPVTDAYIISEFCDTTLFVIRHRYTPKAMIKLLEENSKIKALKNLNIVFNGVKSRGIFNKGYGYGYGYGYEYGYTDRKYMGNT